MTIDHPTDGEIFYQYVKCVLVPAFRPGDIVVLDNLSAHKQKRVFRRRGVCQSIGFLVFNSHEKWLQITIVFFVWCGRLESE